MIGRSARFSLAFFLASLLPAQTPDKKAAPFEAADVHVSAPGARQSGGFMAAGRVELRGRTMLSLIQFAWGIETFQVFGDPPWANTDKFDIVAQMSDAKASQPDLRAWLKNLLSERFKLVTHQEQRDLPVFLLTAANGGAKLTAAADPNAPAKEVPASNGDPTLSVHHSLKSFKMSDLALRLPGMATAFVNHPVIDETGLKGSYDIDIGWMTRVVYNLAKANPDGPPAIGMDEALDKLGLKLEAAKRPQPALVIDSVNETPTPNAEGVTAKLPAIPTEFEAVELRPAKPGAAEAAIAARSGKAGPVTLGPNGYVNIQRGQVEILSATLRGLINLSYGVEDRWIVSAPIWMSKDRFDIVAKAAPGVPIRDMLKKVIDERFALVTHKEDQPMTVYVLSAGKSPKLKASDGKSRSECNIVFTDQRNYVCANTTMAQFAERLPSVAGGYVQPPIIDATGLTGAFDFQFYYTPKRALQDNGATAADSRVQASTPVNEFTLYEAVDKQLGLKLEEKKYPVPVLVVDKANQTPGEK